MILKRKPWHMSPLEIEVLLHVYAIPSPLERNPKEALMRFLVNDLIVEDVARGCGYRTTHRGDKLVEMICNTPLPEYFDPRFSPPAL